MNAREHFAARLRELRQKSGMTQQQLSDVSGITIRQISRFETGDQEPMWSTALARAAALGVNTLAFEQPPSESTETQGRGRPTGRKKGKP